jgi:hypothetical protein
MLLERILMYVCIYLSMCPLCLSVQLSIYVSFLSVCLSVCLSVQLSIYLSVYGSAVLLLDLGRFFSFLILGTVCRAPWKGDQPIASSPPTRRTAQTE